MININSKLPDKNKFYLKKCKSCKNTFILPTNNIKKIDCCIYSNLFDVQEKHSKRFIKKTIFGNFVFFIALIGSLIILSNLNFTNSDTVSKLVLIFGLIAQVIAIVIPSVFFNKFVKRSMMSNSNVVTEMQNGFNNSEIYVSTSVNNILSHPLTSESISQLETYYDLAYKLSYISDSPSLASVRLQILLAMPLTKESFTDLERISLQILSRCNIRKNNVMYFIEKAAEINPIQIGSNTLRLYRKMFNSEGTNVHPLNSSYTYIQRFTSHAKVYSRALVNTTIFKEFEMEILKFIDYMTAWDRNIYFQISK